jgi:hypothetical protein
MTFATAVWKSLHRGPTLAARAASGALAGAGGALALAPTDAVMRAALGRHPAFDLALVTRRLAVRLTGRRPGRRFVARAEWPLRLAYGAALGALLSAAGVSALTATGLLTGAEMLAMPRAGATRPVRFWSTEERWLLLAHAAAFVLVTRAIERLGRRGLV